MKEKQLFPCDTTHLARMMLREDDDGNRNYVIQSRLNKQTQKYESELVVSADSPTAELEAWNIYSGTLDSAIHKILRLRPKIKEALDELNARSAKHGKATFIDVKDMLENMLSIFEEMLR